ncbi:MAG: alpha/beta hydrolase [Actinobacteria bacterium]|nr:MAG: alpha/beta hydrolase [Actinomycetota bacterium]
MGWRMSRDIPARLLLASGRTSCSVRQCEVGRSAHGQEWRRHHHDRHPHRALRRWDDRQLSLRGRRAGGHRPARSPLPGRRLRGLRGGPGRERFTVHTMERRGRGGSGPQGDGYSIARECEDVLAVQSETGASLLVGHSYGGLIALEVARNNDSFAKAAVYEPGVSIDGSMPVDWMPGYEKKFADGKRLDALVQFTLADAPARIRRIPPWLMKAMVGLLMIIQPGYRQMLDLLLQNAREWEEVARLDSSYENYQEVSASVLLLYGGRSDSKAVDLMVERLPAVIPRCETKEFPELDHFGIERTAPRTVAQVVGDYFLK